jgi:malonyl-CoA O-methyltransferase
MTIDQTKKQIRNKFNRAAATYDNYCMTQRAVNNHAMQLLLNYQRVFNTIADFACGTGESTNCLMQHLKFKHCYAVDLAEKLIAVARNKNPNLKNIDWIHSDFDQPLNITQPLDLIFCNMGLQWSCDFHQTMHRWQNYLEKHGLILFSVPMPGNFPELKEAVKPIFLSDCEIIDGLKTNGLRLVTKVFKSFEESFTSQLEVLKSLKATGTNHNKKISQPNHGLKHLNTNDIFINPHVKKITYKIGIYLAMKNL